MRKIAMTVLVIIWLYPLPVKSQDALATFMFLFKDSSHSVPLSIDLWKLAPDTGKDTVHVLEQCVFESREERRSHPTNSNFRILYVKSWDFTKAFFAEMNIEKYLDGHLEFTIPGEKGLTHSAEFCFVDTRSCDRGVWDARENESKEIKRWVSKDNTERVVKALKYFVQNFCPGAKRNSAF